MEKIKILEQLFDNGFVVEEFTIDPTKIKIKLKSLSVKDYIEIDESISNIKESRPSILQKYALERLSRGLLKYKNKEFKDYLEAKEFLQNSNISNFLFNKLVEIQSKFEDEIKNSLNFENLENFFDQEGSPEKSKQQSGG